jgi:hypothetical protein
MLAWGAGVPMKLRTETRLGGKNKQEFHINKRNLISKTTNAEIKKCMKVDGHVPNHYVTFTSCTL